MHKPPTNGEFWKQLTEFGFEPKKSGSRRYRSVPDEKTLRAKINERLGFDDADDAQGTVGDSGDG